VKAKKRTVGTVQRVMDESSPDVRREGDFGKAIASDGNDAKTSQGAVILGKIGMVLSSCWSKKEGKHFQDWLITISKEKEEGC